MECFKVEDREFAHVYFFKEGKKTILYYDFLNGRDMVEYTEKAEANTYGTPTIEERQEARKLAKTVTMEKIVIEDRYKKKTFSHRDRKYYK